jgi:hypothetical protein
MPVKLIQNVNQPLINAKTNVEQAQLVGKHVFGMKGIKMLIT